MNLLDELIAARARMAEREHIQGHTYLLDDGSFCAEIAPCDNIVGCCAMGAFFDVQSGDPGRTQDCFHGAKGFLDSILGESVFNWNDRPGRTKTEVLDLFDKAIAQARSTP